MKFTAKTYYGLVACVELTASYGQGPLRASAIAGKHGIPSRFLELTLGELKNSGLADSKRGSDGGFFLAADPAQITVYDVIHAIEGDIAVLECDKINSDRECMFSEYMGGLKAAIEYYLKQTTLLELYNSVLKKPDVINYFI
jgi:Rrf2 family protein